MSPDSFQIALYDLPPYKIIQDGREVTPNQSADYLAGRYSNEPYAYHYDNFFGYNGSLHEFIFENGSNRNLLLISNSFANPLKPLLASHYQHTYCVDLRYYADFSLSGFLAGHKVDDVLILGDNDVVFEANEWFINP